MGAKKMRAADRRRRVNLTIKPATLKSARRACRDGGTSLSSVVERMIEAWARDPLAPIWRGVVA